MHASSSASSAWLQETIIYLGDGEDSFAVKDREQ